MKSAAAILLAAVLVACTGVGTNFKTPQIAFVGLKMLEADLFAQRLEVRLRVENPNDVNLPVRGLDVDMELAGEQFAHGISAREFTVPANGEAEFDMIVTANAASALIQLLSADKKSQENIEYRLKGKLSTRLGMLRSIPFDEKGSLPIASIIRKKVRKSD